MDGKRAIINWKNAKCRRDNRFLGRISEIRPEIEFLTLFRRNSFLLQTRPGNYNLAFVTVFPTSSQWVKIPPATPSTRLGTTH